MFVSVFKFFGIEWFTVFGLDLEFDLFFNPFVHIQKMALVCILDLFQGADEFIQDCVS